jgi:DNA-binding response OmpR family regulator
MRRKGRYKVLVVDDEEDLRELVMEVLRTTGLQVYGASKGEEALKKVKKVKPDLILLDVMMPDIDGWEVCRRIKDNPETRRITVSMLTVKGQDIDKIRSFDYAIADWHISKPINMEELTRTVLWLLEKPLRRGGRDPWESP